jgi:hypothetical protein
MGYIWPVNADISQDFGALPNNGFNPPGGHTGRDFKVGVGTPVHAIADGTVVAVGQLPEPYSSNQWWIEGQWAGNVVIIDHGPLVSIYAHLSEWYVNIGDRVSQGEVVAASGATGGASTGPHLHFEVMPDGWDFNNGTYGRVNPSLYCSGFADNIVTPGTTLQPYQRIVGQYGVNKRESPASGAAVVDNFPAGSVLDFGGYVHGELVNGTDIWFVGKYSGGYFSASAFDDGSGAGLDDLTPAPATPKLAANQRLTTMWVNQRKAPSTTGEIVKRFEANVVLDFKGFVHGENFNGTDIWFVGAYSDTYFWAGKFTDPSTQGLSDLTPKPVPAPTPAPATGRTTGSAPVNFRTGPYTTSALIDTLPANTGFSSFTVFTHGEAVNGNDVWFKGTVRGGYAWSGAFTDTSTKGMTEEAAPAAPVQPVTDTYTFKPDFDFVEYIPANINNVERGRFPVNPSHEVIHQFGTPGVDTIGSTINQFQNPNLGAKAVSAHFVVSGKRIVQMVSLSDRAYHAYTVGNDYIGIETDPNQDADTIASVNKLLRAIKAKYGYTPVTIRHKDVPQCVTNCGALINLDNYQIDAPVTPVTPVPVPAPTPAPVPAPTPTPAPEPVDLSSEQALKVIAAFQKWQLDAWTLYNQK